MNELIELFEIDNWLQLLLVLWLLVFTASWAWGAGGGRRKK